MEVNDFKAKLNKLLENANPEIVYRIKCDLAIQTNMPFYKDRPTKGKVRRIKPRESLRQMLLFFLECHDKEFISLLLKKLSVNQGQIIRKVAPRIGSKSDIWDHAIPVKYIVEELIKMVIKNDLSELDKLLEIYILAGQRGITKEQDLLLKDMKSSMPVNWDWRQADVDPLARHRRVGILQ